MICVGFKAGEGILEEWYTISISVKIQVSVSARKSIFPQEDSDGKMVVDIN